MPLVQPSPWIRYQFFDANGDPLAFGFVYSFAAGTNTPLATYTDSTGTVQNTNPIQLDAGGYADIWLTAASYKIRVEDANHVPLYTIDGLPGLGSIISVGNLSPLFTTVLAGGALNFTLSDAAPGTIFGRFAGTTGPPSFGAIGSDKQITYNDGGAMAGDPDLTWDKVLQTLSIKDAGSNYIRLVAGAPGGRIIFGTGTAPYIQDVTDWEFGSDTSSDFRFGFSGSETGVFKIYTPSGSAGFALGIASLGVASHAGRLMLNNANNAAGVLAGPSVIAGFVADPNTVIVAPTGSLFITTNGGATTTLWVKESSPTTSTGWVAK